jgi:signal recognition particle receptor subunit beta
MAMIVVADREIHLKIVYYGPGLSGKTTNLAWLHEHLPASSKSELVSIEGNQDRTLFFDFLPLELPPIGDFRVRLHLYSVPGQERFGSTRAAHLRGVDGIVFVADSQRDRVAVNLASLAELESTLAALGFEPGDVPIVLQYNKSDLPGVLTRPQLDAHLNALGRPSRTAAAIDGTGVVESLRMVLEPALLRV